MVKQQNSSAPQPRFASYTYADAKPISITFLPNHSLINSLFFPAVSADTRYCQLGIHRGIHACLYAAQTCNVVYSLINSGSLPVPY